MTTVSLLTPTALGEPIRLSTSIGAWHTAHIQTMAGEDYVVFIIDGVAVTTSGQIMYAGRDYGVVVCNKEAAETLMAALTPFVQMTGDRRPSLSVYYLGEEETLLKIPPEITTYNHLWNQVLRDDRALEPLYTTANDVLVTTSGPLAAEGIRVVVMPFVFYTVTEMKYTPRGHFPLPLVGYTPNLFKGPHIVAVYDMNGRRIIGGKGLVADNEYYLILREEGGLCEVACQVATVNRKRDATTQFAALHVMMGEKQKPRKIRWHKGDDTDDLNGQFDSDHDVVIQIFINGKPASLHEEFIPPHAYVEVDVMRQVK